MRTSSRLLAALAAFAMVPLTSLPALAAEPASGSVTPESDAAWSGSFTVADPVTGTCAGGNPSCDVFELTVDTQGEDLDLEVHVVSETIDIDLFVYDANGAQVGKSADPGPEETTIVEGVEDGVYTVATQGWAVFPGDTYEGTATLNPLAGAVDQDEVPTDADVLWDYDARGPQVTAEVPLRIVFVGFDEGEFDEEAILQEIPDRQQVGTLNTYGGGFRSGDQSDLFGLDTLVNHGRSYYSDSSSAPLLPIEMQWKPEIHYAPSEFADALFEEMVAQGTYAPYHDLANYQQYHARYNATRGNPARIAASGDPDTAVMPGADVLKIDAEAVEDWVATNTEDYLGFPADNSLDDPGYTFYVLNTWDAPEAQAHFPKDRYHNFDMSRIDPDTGTEDGIDWGRVWGGRYRFFMYDLGAAPNPYEAESWGNRRRSVDGSAAYDPPLWEYRAEMPRNVTLMHAADGMEQAVTPGETWDHEHLQYMIARSLNQAVSFRFFHSYLYEPRPGTGRFFLSDNVWHDQQAELLFPSELERLYDQETAIEGLRTLTPYFEFQGDVVYQYLTETDTNPEFAADQAALDQAKQDGDDITAELAPVGAAHVAMYTVTMMDYLDANPDRFLRGGSCFTTVPTIQVVVPGHYAWALPIAAGIATNRDGVPWGFLNSTNDVFKWSGADRDPTLAMAHPQPLGGGGFTYTTVHEASHYLGLAHPHDTVGAVRGPDGEPVYYDGFTWMYNPTAAPTTYSHPELVYSVLDQESIARGHLSYYLVWSDEALAEVGATLLEQGVTQLADLPAEWRELRQTAIDEMATAEQLYADFDFVAATFAGKRAWLAASALRDGVLGLEPGTSEFERGTRLAPETDPAACGAAPDGPTEPTVDPVVDPAVDPADDGHDHGDGSSLPATGGGMTAIAMSLLGAALMGSEWMRRRAVA